jgi:hypothetical protein
MCVAEADWALCLLACPFFGSSLCVIMLEITNDLQFLPPIMLAGNFVSVGGRASQIWAANNPYSAVVMCAKLIGDMINHPLYDMVLALKYVPFLEAEPSHEMDRMVRV